MDPLQCRCSKVKSKVTTSNWRTELLRRNVIDANVVRVRLGLFLTCPARRHALRAIPATVCFGYGLGCDCEADGGRAYYAALLHRRLQII